MVLLYWGIELFVNCCWTGVSESLDLQRPIALGLYGLALIGDRYLLTPTPGLEWFLPLFFLKLLISHLLNETAYPPSDRYQSNRTTVTALDLSMSNRKSAP
ncbi:hypothetical protein PN498_22045 [Oscillatoria sp. CS-180]|nr:hypothetical protein [Oscillatoria sp. CS-180]